MNFPLHNKSRRIKSETVTRLTNYASSLKKRLNIKTRFNVANKIHKVNVTDQPLNKLPKYFLLKMDKYFQHDFNLISEFVNKDLVAINCLDVNAGIFGPANIHKKHVFNRKLVKLTTINSIL